MRVYHGPQNIGGMAGVLAAAQRDLNIDAISKCFATGNYNFKVDEEIAYEMGSPTKILKSLIKQIINFDVFHFYFGESLLGPSLKDIYILKKLKKKIFFYFCGCDVRDSKITINKYEFSACKVCWPMACSANSKTAIEIAKKYADGIAVTTPDLLEFVDNSVLLPQPIDMEFFESVCKRVSESLEHPHLDKNGLKKITIAHAPSNRLLKGTAYVEKSIEELRAANYQVDLILIEKMDYEKAIYECAKADIVIDQLLIGSYGQYAVEMMALGKPVVCYIREDLCKHYPPSLPIVNANPINLTNKLKELLDNHTSWKRLSEEGKKYVSQMHDSKIIAEKFIKMYQRSFDESLNANG